MDGDDVVVVEEADESGGGAAAETISQRRRREFAADMDRNQPIGEIMVFHPTLDEMKDFSAYIEYMESQGAHRLGIAKVCVCVFVLLTVWLVVGVGQTWMCRHTWIAMFDGGGFFFW